MGEFSLPEDILIRWVDVGVSEPPPPLPAELRSGAILRSMQNLKAEPPKRVPLKISGDSETGKVILGGVDVTADLRRLIVDLTAFDCVATIELDVDVDFDFPVSEVAKVGADPLAGLTAKELSQAAANCPIEKPMGDHLLEHLKTRGQQSAQ